MATVDLKAIISAEDRASKVIKGFASSAGSSLTDLGGKIAKMGAVGVTALAGMGVAAIKSASDMQMLRTNLDVLTGSAEKGAKIFKDLNTFAAKTPFETNELAKATSTMLGFGISTEDAMKHLKTLGDIALGDKNKLQGITLAFSQIKSTGRLMGQDLLQLINNGFNPLSEISKKTGKSIKELKEDMENGAISADMVTEAFESATREGGLFFNGMEKGSQTFQGRLSTLKDNLWITARAVIGLSDTGEVVKGGLFDKVSLALNEMAVWLDANKEKIIELGIAFVNNLLAAGQQVVVFLGNLINWFKEHKMIAESLAIAVGVVLTAAFASWAVSVIAATWPILAIIAAITAVTFAIKYLISHWGAISNFFHSLGAVAVSVGSTIKGIFSNIGQSIVSGFKWYVNTVISGVNGLIRGFNRLPVPDIPLIPMLAKGGPVKAGMPYIVGEKGPELFVPNSSGKVIANDKLGNMGGSNVVININEMSVRSQSDIDMIGREIGRQVGLALRGSY